MTPAAEDPLDQMPILALVGPTASGKTALGLALAEALSAEILSMDSMLVYRGLDIGTAKPSPQERARIPHHLIDLVDPEEVFDVSRWLQAARTAVSDCLSRGKTPLFVGGTGFFLAALLRGLFDGPPPDQALRAEIEQRARELSPERLHAEFLAADPVAAAKIHPADTRRVMRGLEVLRQTGRPLSAWQAEWASPKPRLLNARLVGLKIESALLDRRIEGRTRSMLRAGWPEEAARLFENGLGRGAAQALGYREALALSRGELSEEEAVQQITLRTRQFARRQRTWYRKFEIRWLPFDAPDLVAQAPAWLAPPT